jgi:hypothetical protein
MMKYLLSALSVVLIFTACNRTPQTPALNREDILRTGKWKISSGTLTIKLPNGLDTTMNYLNFISACHLDDYIVFDSQMHAEVYSGSDKCNPGDPDYIPFVWQLLNNNTQIDLYNGFNCIYGAHDSIYAYNFDTLFNNASGTPPLVLDTIEGTLDTLIGFAPKTIIVLDTMWQLKIDTANVPNSNIFNAQISNFSQAAFTLNFSLISKYPDTTNLHMGPPHLSPIWRNDTFRYVVTYSNF